MNKQKYNILFYLLFISSYLVAETITESRKNAITRAIENVGPTVASINVVQDVVAEASARNKLHDLRKERTRKLAETDWTSNSDVVMSDEMKKYRQELRDITKTYKTLDDVKWPTKPS